MVYIEIGAHLLHDEILTRTSKSSPGAVYPY